MKRQPASPNTRLLNMPRGELYGQVVCQGDSGFTPSASRQQASAFPVMPLEYEWRINR